MWAIVGYILLTLLALLLLFLVAPLFVKLSFHGELRMTVYVLGIPLHVYTGEKPLKESTTESTENLPPQKRVNAVAKALKEDGVGTTLAYCKRLAELSYTAAKRVIAAVTVDKLDLALYIAAEEAAATAITVGRISAVLYPALSALQSKLRIRHRAVTVTPDFLAENGRVDAHVLLHAVPVRLVWAALCWFIGTSIAKKEKQKQVTIKKEEATHGQ